MQMMIPAGVNVLEYLRDRGVFIPAACSGSGVCGKCVVKLLAGSLDITENDKLHLSESALDEGCRLACCACTKGVVRIGVGEYGEQVSADISRPADTSHTFGLALDIGTTTLALSLVDIDEKRPVRSLSALNRQAVFGADVITRVKSSLSGRREALRKLVRESVAALIKSIDCSHLDVRKMTVSANTAMYHMLLGLDCSGISKAPFEPATLGGECLPLKDLLGESFPECGAADIPVNLVKGISAFVGGDVVSGLVSAYDRFFDANTLFADLGTNGESALVSSGRIICTSAAAGPALEGGELSCGMGGVKGAVSRVYRNGGGFGYDVIGGGEAKGICGAAAIDLISLMLEDSLIDKTGKLADVYFENGFALAPQVCLTQGDIHAVLLAKSAIRSSLETLLHLFNVTPDSLLISGGLGSYIDVKNAAACGLIPRVRNTKVLGNTSLKGAELSLYDTSFASRAEDIRNKAEIIDLTENEYFKQKFIEYMSF